MNINSLKNLTSEFRFKKGHTKPKNAHSFSKGHQTNVGKKQSEKQKEKKRVLMAGNKFAVGSKGNSGQRWKIKDTSKMFGHTPWNKGLPKEKQPSFGKHWKVKDTSKIILAHKGEKGKHFSLKTEFKKGQNKGEKNLRWKGGITPENIKIRNSIETKLWKQSVFAKDGYTCQKTGIKGGKLIAHHIQNFSKYPELRFAIDNGITLSEKSHKEFHKKYGIKNNSREQLLEFLSNYGE